MENVDVWRNCTGDAVIRQFVQLIRTDGVVLRWTAVPPPPTYGRKT